MEKIFYIVLCLYIIPMWAAAIMRIIYICIRTRKREIQFCSSTIKDYFFEILVPGVNILVCIIMIFDVIACRLKKYFNSKFTK